MQHLTSPKRTLQWQRTHRCKHRHKYIHHPKCLNVYVVPKILFLDIETSPAEGLFWDIYETNVLKVTTQWRILCIGYKWQGKKTQILSGNEKQLCKKIRDLLHTADFVVGHNGDRFDLRRIQTRIAFYHITPPSPYKSYDTLKRIKKHFGLLSNKLGDVSEYFGFGFKLQTGGKDLWVQYMAGNKKAKRKMHLYCKNDVNLLEKLYILLRPWEER